MIYKHKLVPRYQYDALRLMLGAIILSGLIGLVAKKVEAIFTPPLITPIADTPREYVEVFVSPDSIEDQIKAVFGKDGNMAVKVAKCESGLNPKAKNKTSSARGLFQVMQSWHKIDQKWLFIPEVNIQVAYKLFTEQGWEPWRASNHCHHALK